VLIGNHFRLSAQGAQAHLMQVLELSEGQLVVGNRARGCTTRFQRCFEPLREVAPLSWTPDLLNFGSLQWQESTHPMRRNSAGRW
jgi:hypothetical protein